MKVRHVVKIPVYVTDWNFIRKRQMNNENDLVVTTGPPE